MAKQNFDFTQNNGALVLSNNQDPQNTSFRVSIDVEIKFWTEIDHFGPQTWQKPGIFLVQVWPYGLNEYKNVILYICLGQICKSINNSGIDLPDTSALTFKNTQNYISKIKCKIQMAFLTKVWLKKYQKASIRYKKSLEFLLKLKCFRATN